MRSTIVVDICDVLLLLVAKTACCTFFDCSHGTAGAGYRVVWHPVRCVQNEGAVRNPLTMLCALYGGKQLLALAHLSSVYTMSRWCHRAGGMHARSKVEIGRDARRASAGRHGGCEIQLLTRILRLPPGAVHVFDTRTVLTIGLLLNTYSYIGNTGQLEDCDEEHPHHVCCYA